MQGEMLYEGGAHLPGLGPGPYAFKGRRDPKAPNKPFHCEFPGCDKSFFRRAEMNRHQRWKHGGHFAEGSAQAKEIIGLQMAVSSHDSPSLQDRNIVNEDVLLLDQSANSHPEENITNSSGNQQNQIPDSAVGDWMLG